MNIISKNFGAVIMVGGSGRRMGKLTTNTPKPLLKIGNQAILDYVLRSIECLGIQQKNIIVVVKYLAEQIYSHLSNTDFTVITGQQKNIALNLVDVLPNLPENFITASSDLYSFDLLQEAVAVHQKSKASATLIIAKLDADIPRRKYWHYSIEDGFLRNLELGAELSDWERDILILKKNAVEKITDRLKQILQSSSSLEEKYKQFSTGWNLILKLFLDEGLKVRILQKDFCRCFRINFPTDLDRAVSIVENLNLNLA